MGKTKVQNVIVALRAKTKGFASSMKGAKGALGGFASKFGGLKSIIAGAGLAAVLTGSVSAAVDFEKQMSRVSTMLSGPDMAWMDKYKSGLNDMSVKFGESTEILSDGLYNLLSASVPPAKALDVLKVATEAAKGGFTDTGVAVDGITNILNAYGQSADFAGAVSDKMAMTVARGKITFAELASNIGKVAPAAKAGGESMDTMLGLMAALTKQGISASESTTQISAMLRAAAKQGTSLMGLVEKFKGKSLGDILKAGLDETSAKAIAAMSGNIKGLQADIEAMANSSGARLAAFGKQQNTFSARWDKLRETLARVSRSFGQGLMPVAEKFLNYAGRLSQKLNALSDKDYENIIQKVITFGKVLGGIWAASKIFTGIKRATEAFSVLSNGVSLASTAITKFTNYGVLRFANSASAKLGNLSSVFRSIGGTAGMAGIGIVGGVVAALGYIVSEGQKAVAVMGKIENLTKDSAELAEKEKELLADYDYAENAEERLNIARQLLDVRKQLAKAAEAELKAGKDANKAGWFGDEVDLMTHRKMVDARNKSVEDTKDFIQNMKADARAERRQKVRQIEAAQPSPQLDRMQADISQAAKSINTAAANPAMNSEVVSLLQDIKTLLGRIAENTIPRAVIG